MKTDNNASAYPHTNLILYGPPGTGKTYYAKNYALAAIQGVKPENLLETDRGAINQTYQQLTDEGRIQFVTFHQSFTYEDFIEGIKPELSHDRAEAFTGKQARDVPQLRYVLEDGIFKRMCIMAAYAIYQAEKVPLAVWTELVEKRHKPDFDELYVAFIAEQMNLLKRKVAVGYSSKRQREVTLLSVNAKGNLLMATGLRGHRYVVTRNKLRKLYQTYAHIEEIHRLASGISQVIGGGNTTLYWTAFNELKEFEKSLEIATGSELAEVEDSVLEQQEAAEYATMAQAAESLDWSKVKPESLAKATRYALVIDEINRGNISQIFGELITLIEADKRGGRAEALTVQLPYSKTAFTVPPNLYIIGTMNTADRNVESLDTALRRRFVFVEMPPDYTLLEDKFGQNTVPNIARMLKAINRRISKLLGKDYAIGHAYFLNLKDATDISGLKIIFENHLIPLLQEYFFGNEGKMELVIGEAFFDKQMDKPDGRASFFAESDWAASHYEVREEWTDYQSGSLRKVQQMSDLAFVEAVVKIYDK